MSIRRNPAPAESPQARHAIVEMYRALLVLRENHLLDFIAEKAWDEKASQQCEDAIAQAELSMSPNLLITLLPAYTEIAFLTDRNREDDKPMHGIIRDGAWGFFPDSHGNPYERRVTTNGFEFFVNPETVFTHFEITKRER